MDCRDGSDEFIDCTRTYFSNTIIKLRTFNYIIDNLACNVTYYGEIGRTYELEVKRPKDNQIPFLCYLNFTAGSGLALGELVQVRK